MDHFWRFETSAVHAGYEPGENERSVAVPIHHGAAFAFDDMQHAVEIFDGRRPGYIYSRIANPTVRVLEARLTALEQGAGCVATASGQAALAAAFLTLVRAGDNIVASAALYGTTYNLLQNVLAQYQVQARFVPPNDLRAFESAIDPRTRAVFCETISNPAIGVADIASLAAIAHEHGVPLIVDNTVATPYLCQPISHGADIVVHSLTKYLAGHGTALGGAVVDGGRFPWAAHADRYPQLTQPDPCHHGTIFTHTCGPCAFVGRCACVPVRTLGAVLSPVAASSIMEGMETLALRMERICFNAEVIASYLCAHPAVERVVYAGAPDHVDAELAGRYLGGRGSGVVALHLKGGADAIHRFQDALRLVRRSVNLGDCKTLVCHPASTTHRQLCPEDRARSGVTDGLVRLSIGIEHVEDLITDIDRALAAAG